MKSFKKWNYGALNNLLIFILFKKLKITSERANCEPLPKYVNFATHNWSRGLNEPKLRREEAEANAEAKTSRSAESDAGRDAEPARRERNRAVEKDTQAMNAKSWSSCRALSNIREQATVAVAVRLENDLHAHMHANGRCKRRASSAVRLCIRNARVQQRINTNNKHFSWNCLVTWSEPTLKLYFSICRILFILQSFYNRLCNVSYAL